MSKQAARRPLPLGAAPALLRGRRPRRYPISTDRLLETSDSKADIVKTAGRLVTTALRTPKGA